MRAWLTIFGLLLFSSTASFAVDETPFLRFDSEICYRPEDSSLWGLSKQQVEALCAASHFNVILLRKGDQRLVLIGENHRTTLQGQAEAKALIELFPFRSFEYASASITNIITPISHIPITEFQYPSLSMWNIQDGLSIYTFMTPRFNGNSGGPEFTEFRKNMNQAPALTNNWGHLSYFKKRVYPHFRKAYPQAALAINLEPDDEMYDTRIRQRALTMCKKNEPCTDAVVVDYRNFIMRETAMKALETFPEEKTMLMIVGMAHVEGLVQGFVCEGGFERHTLSMRGKFTFANALYKAEVKFYGPNRKIVEPASEYFEQSKVTCVND